MRSAEETGAAEMWSAAKAAAERLAHLGLPCPCLTLGADLPEATVRALVAEAGGELHEHVSAHGGERPVLIVSMCAEYEGVTIRAQGERPATAEDVRRLGRARRWLGSEVLTVEQALESVQ